MDFGNELFSTKKKCQRFDYTDEIFLLDTLCESDFQGIPK